MSDELYAFIGKLMLIGFGILIACGVIGFFLERLFFQEDPLKAINRDCPRRRR